MEHDRKVDPSRALAPFSTQPAAGRLKLAVCPFGCLDRCDEHALFPCCIDTNPAPLRRPELLPFSVYQ